MLLWRLMSRLEEGRQAKADADRILTGSILPGDQVGDEANRNVKSLLFDLRGRSPREAMQIYEHTLYKSRRK